MKNHGMTFRYAGQVIKHLSHYPMLWSSLVILPLVLGTMYGLLYRSLFSTGLDQMTAVKTSQLSNLIHVIQGGQVLSSVATMQLSVFTGLSFFLSSFGVAMFIKYREKNLAKRLITMGFSDGHVFWGEACAYLLFNVVVVSVFNGVFYCLNGLYNQTLPGLFLGVIIMIFIQSVVGAGYGLLFLGWIKKESTFSLFHFIPAFVLSFIGGAMFPVAQVSSEGLYQWMPTYVLSTFYTGIYEGRLAFEQKEWFQCAAVLGLGILLTVIGRLKFSLKEVA